MGLPQEQLKDDTAPMRSTRGRMPSGKPNPVDVHVGARVRLRRTLLGMSQEKLGEQKNVGSRNRTVATVPDPSGSSDTAVMSASMDSRTISPASTGGTPKMSISVCVSTAPYVS